LKVRATAVAAERSNAIGTVELECTPHGLALVYLGVGSFTEGYAPGALTMGTKVLVPWPQVQSARVEGEELFLGLDSVLTPHSRLVLVGFSTGENEHRGEAKKQRLVIWVGAAAAAIVAAMVSSLTVPRVAPQAGAGAAIFVAGIAAFSILVIGLLADRQIGSRGLVGDAAREAFTYDLARHVPSLVRLPALPAKPTKPFVFPTFEGLWPRTTAAVVISLSACLLGALLTARWLLLPGDRSEPVASRGEREPLRDEPEQPTQNVTAPAPPPAESSQASAKAAETSPNPDLSLGAHCTCARSDSPLWNEPIEQLSSLVISQKTTSGPSAKRTELEIAAINNSDKDVRELAMQIEFSDQDPPPSNKKYPVANEAVYFEGPLTPGQAIKWSVEARGSTFTVSHPRPGTIGPAGDAAAPTNLLAELLNANHRPVRLHGAMMLAYLGDPRAKEATLKLKEALREEEGPFLDRVLRALSDVKTCNVRISGGGPKRTVEACVFNGSKEPRQKLGLRVRVLGAKVDRAAPTAPPPPVVAEATVKLPGEVAPQAGVVVKAEVELAYSGEPAAIETFADREDLLPQ
jgi:hypothetical protein